MTLFLSVAMGDEKMREKELVLLSDIFSSQVSGSPEVRVSEADTCLSEGLSTLEWEIHVIIHV